MTARSPTPPVFAFAAQFVALDVYARGAAAYAHRPALFVGAAASVAFSLLLASFARASSWRALLAVTAATVLVVDGYVCRYYGTLLDFQVATSAAEGWADVRPIALALAPRVAALIALVSAVEYAALAVRPWPASLRARQALGLVSFVCAVTAPRSALPPEMRAARAVRALWGSRDPRAEGTVSLPPLPSLRDQPPSVLLVLTESVRASSYCTDPGAPCTLSPEVNRLFPDRIPLRQMRSIASYTALSVATLLTGRPLVGPNRTASSLGDAPTLFDYARASRLGGRPPWIAYWSGQAATVVPARVRSTVDSWITLETILGHPVEDEDDAVEADMDRRLSERCVEEMPRVPTPALLVLHLLGTHAPYFVDPARAPFQPTESVITWEGLGRVENAYRDAILAQDHSLVPCLRAFVEHQGSRPWMVVFTSDHGEAFGEHGAIHHGQNFYDEQIHVPGWVAFGEETFGASQRANLVSHEDAFVTHLDVVPTILDALGLLDALPMAPLRARLAGRSLLAPVADPSPIPVTNCTPIFPCPLDTWGVLGSGHGLIAQPWDGDWNCVDFTTGRERTADAPCGVLRAESRTYFPTLPNGSPNE
jgi:glucan phosphoethanolaminetransferase (alkaline phosphatase superfamily)